MFKSVFTKYVAAFMAIIIASFAVLALFVGAMIYSNSIEEYQYIAEESAFTVKDYLENGITTIQDGATTGRDFALLKLLSSLGMLKLDVVAYPMMGEQGDKIMQKNQ